MNPPATPFELRYRQIAERDGSWYEPSFQAKVGEAWRERVRRLGLQPGHLVEFGCGTGENLAALKVDGWSVQGFEISESAVSILRSRYPGISATVADLGVPMETSSAIADVVIDGHCYHFQIGERRRTYLANVRRLLKSDGWFILATSIGVPDLAYADYDPETRVSRIAGVDTNYWAEPDEVRTELNAAGFVLHAEEVVRDQAECFVAWCQPNV